jgi:CHAT domain-containing protein/tetratricopeptide (TPR) repeat protein
VINPLDLPDEPTLLRWCAIAPDLEASDLLALAHVEAGTAERLLRSPVFEPAGITGRYRLRSEHRRTALAKLRLEEPRAEIRLHAACLDHWLTQLAPPPSPPRDDLEARCLYHLAVLHDLYTEYVAWESIHPHLQAARNAGMGSTRALAWLEFFEAYAAVRGEATEAGRERLEALLRRPDLDEALRARVLHACSLPEADRGQYQAALQLCRETLALAETQGDLYRQGYALLSIGIIYNDLEDHQRALDYCERSLALFQQTGAPYREAHALYEIGNNAVRLGKWQRASAALEAATVLYTQLGVTRRLVMTCWAQGVMYLMLGEWETSQAALEQALAIALAPNGEIPSAAMDTLVQLGLLHEVQGRYAAAQTCYERALVFAGQQQLRHYQCLYLYRLAEALRLQEQFAVAARTYRQAVETVETLRSALELEELKLNLLGTTQYIYESLVLLSVAHETPAAAFEWVEQARARAFLDMLARHSPELYAGYEQPTVTLAELQAELRPGDVLLEYFTTGMLPPGDHALHHLPAHNRRLREVLVPAAKVLLFAVTCDRLEVYSLPLDPNRLRPSVHVEDPVLAMLQAERRARWLYDQLIKPIEPLLQDCRQLYVVPHGPLHYLPFGALRDDDGDFLLRANGPAIALAPSATVLVRSCLRRPASAGQRALAIGYNDPRGQPLVHAETEAQLVASRLGGQAWTGPEDKRAGLIVTAPELRWLHIAGHAQYDHRDPLASSLRLGAADDLNALQIMSDLHLQADLVTLSACLSGFSQIVPGDELLGLQRAWLYAGAATVVCTLARTRDVVALLVMDQFYQRLLTGASAAAALQAALVAVRTMPREAVVQELQRLGYQATAGEEVLPASAAGPGTIDDYPFARPEYWGPFMLIGRP